MVDRDQVRALSSHAELYRERVPVHRLEQRPVAQQIKLAAALANHLWDLVGDCSPVLVTDSSMSAMARLALPDDGRVHVYKASGAIEAFITSAASRPPIADDESRADRDAIKMRLREVAERLAKRLLTKGEELKPERLWETKARGLTMKREPSKVALLEVTGSLRRYVHGLPVLGRASVHVTVGRANEVTKWGVDWRPVEGDAVGEAKVVDPDEGARRVLAELRNRRGGGKDGHENREPERMTLGYLSLPRRVEQRFLQPAWIATFPPGKGTTMGAIVAVSAATTAFESIGLPGRAATGTAPRR